MAVIRVTASLRWLCSCGFVTMSGTTMKNGAGHGARAGAAASSQVGYHRTRCDRVENKPDGEWAWIIVSAHERFCDGTSRVPQRLIDTHSTSYKTVLSRLREGPPQELAVTSVT